MKIIKNLLLSDDIKDKQLKKILKTLPKEKKQKGYQFLIMRKVGNNLLEMVSDKELYYRNNKEDILLFGIVKKQEQGYLIITDLGQALVNQGLTISKKSILKHLLKIERSQVTFEVK